MVKNMKVCCNSSETSLEKDSTGAVARDMLKLNCRNKKI